jgi:ribosome-binding factor A
VKAPGRRQQRVAEAIREIVAPFLQREVRDPRITALVTVTTVKVTPDLKRAVVGVAILGDEAERVRTLEGLVSAEPAVRHELGRKLQLRSVPEVVFELDRGADHAARIEAVFAALRRAQDAGS